MYDDMVEDPNINPNMMNDDSSDEDVQIRDGDQLILIGQTEDEAASLAVYLYNDELEQLFVHHDFMLADIPLCVEWIGAAPVTREAANWCAVGTLSPEIELWNLDILNASNPHAVLSGAPVDPADMDELASLQRKMDKKKKGKNHKPMEGKEVELGGHTDSVLGLAWNRLQVNVLASASADRTVRLWDLHSTQCSAVFDSLHTDKIQSVVWNPAQATVLATGGFDQIVRVADIRSPNTALQIRLESDVETLVWQDPQSLIVSLENGQICKFDVTALDKGPVWRLSAHDKACTGIALSSKLPGLLISCSLDASLKIWDVRNNQPKLSAVRTDQFGPGALFGVQISEATPYMCVIASEGEDLQLFDFKSALNGVF